MTHLLPALKRLPLFSELALVVMFAWLVAGWLLPQHQIQRSNMVEDIGKATPSLPDLNAILGAHLFGQAPQRAPAISAVKQQPKAIIIQPLSIKLLGTMVAGDASAAIIALTLGAEQQTFFIGDIIQPNATLKIVEPYAIIVDRNGRLERISLEQGEQLKTIAMTPVETAHNKYATLENEEYDLEEPDLEDQASDENEDGGEASSSQAINIKHFQQQLQNLPALLSQARARPHFVNGKIAGFSLSNISPGSLYSQAGLRNGDIVLSINGEQITNAQQAMAVYAELKTASTLDIKLMRATGIQHLRYDLR